VVGLRTATHGFKIPKDSRFAKYDHSYKGDDFKGGFGRQILGETWVGHYGPNHKSSTRLDIVTSEASHPILRGVQDMWVEIGAYNADPIAPAHDIELPGKTLGDVGVLANYAGLLRRVGRQVVKLRRRR
jgi:hypothetical protein